jgi:ATP-dependent RNA helicase DeaD
MQAQCFEDLPISKNVLNGLKNLGFSNLFPIQAQAILPQLEGRDVIGQAHTGTGKTAAFGVPIVERLNPDIKKVQALVLEPTRELAIQTAEHIQQICKYTPLKVLPIYGGTSIQRQIERLKKGVHIVVGTPGRLIDHLNRRTLNLASLTIVVLDEADRMLDMGFIEDIEYILSRTPVTRQTSLFSATIDKAVMNVCYRYMKNPEKILVSKDEITLTQIKQYYMIVNSQDKLSILLSLLENNSIERAIIFRKTRRGTDWLANKLQRRRYNAKPLHGGFTQRQRELVVNSFKQGNLRILIATDVAARGLDIQGVSHIINFDVPLEPLVYFHRIGRTARMEQEGTAISFVSYGEITVFNQIKNLTNTEITELEINPLSIGDPQCILPTR